MKRFYFNRKDDVYLVYDGPFSNTIAIATVYDIEVADLICEALNKYWEATHAATTTTTDSPAA